MANPTEKQETDIQDRINAGRLFEHAQALGLTPEQIRDAAFHLQNRPLRAEMVQAVRDTLLSSLIDATEMLAVLGEVRKQLVANMAPAAGDDYTKASVKQ